MLPAAGETYVRVMRDLGVFLVALCFAWRENETLGMIDAAHACLPAFVHAAPWMRVQE